MQTRLSKGLPPLTAFTSFANLRTESKEESWGEEEKKGGEEVSPTSTFFFLTQDIATTSTARAQYNRTTYIQVTDSEHIWAKVKLLCHLLHLLGITHTTNYIVLSLSSQGLTKLLLRGGKGGGAVVLVSVKKMYEGRTCNINLKRYM